MKNFFAGLAMVALGVFLIAQNTIVRTGLNLRRFTGGYNPSFGVLVLPIMIGIILLFTMKRKIIGCLLIVLGILIIMLSLLMGLEVYFKTTSLYIVVLMFSIVAIGIGLIIRGIFQRRA